MTAYFPNNAFDEDSRADAFSAKFHADLLTAFNEPSLYAGRPTGSIFRLLQSDGWIGSVTIVPGDDTAILTSKQLDFAGTAPVPEGAYVKGARELSTSEWRRFRSRFDDANFWNLEMANSTQSAWAGWVAMHLRGT